MTKVTMRVPDMSCDHCVATVSNAVGQVEGVTEVKVDLADKRVHVDGQELELAPIVEAIREAGYEAEQP